MLEVSTHGRVRIDGKLLCKERHGTFGRVKWKGKRYDVARVVRRAVARQVGRAARMGATRVEGGVTAPPHL